MNWNGRARRFIFSPNSHLSGIRVRGVIVDDDTVPAQPTGLAARPGAGEVTLTWNDPGNDSITGYELRQKVNGGSWGEWTGIQGSVATTVSHTVTGLTNGTEYVYQIRAVSAAGAGEASESVKATPSSSLAVPPLPVGEVVLRQERHNLQRRRQPVRLDKLQDQGHPEDGVVHGYRARGRGQ